LLKNAEKYKHFQGKITMKTRLLLVFAVGLLNAVYTTSSQAEEPQWLQYASGSREAQQIIGDTMGIGLEVTDKSPAGVSLPEFKGDKPLFAQWKSLMAKGGSLWIALDQTKKNGHYDLLYIDSNGDGSLKDETAITIYDTSNFMVNTSKGQSPGYSNYFNPARVILEGEDGPVTYHLNFGFQSYSDRNGLSACSGCWYEGTITVGGEKKFCVLIDYNVNGRFNDKGLYSADSDRIRIGSKESKDRKETRFTGNYIEVAGTLYKLEAAADGAFVKLTKAEDVKYGNIEVQPAISGFSAGGENGLFYIPIEKGIGKLPAGKYLINTWQIDRKDDKNNNWSLKGQSFGDKGIFEVAEGGTVKIDVGEPVMSSLTANVSKGQYTFQQKLTGRLDESIELSCNGNIRPRPPKLVLKSKDGTYEKSFTFEYG
jgi:hypothetical protein